MECSCSISHYHDNEETIGYQERKMRAAKEHFCDECKRVVSKGEHFTFHSILMTENRIYNYKLCDECQEVVKTFFRDGWIFGQIWEDLNYYLEENWSEDLPSNCISKLSPRVRDSVCNILQEWQE